MFVGEDLVLLWTPKTLTDKQGLHKNKAMKNKGENLHRDVTLHVPFSLPGNKRDGRKKSLDIGSGIRLV